MKIIISPAKKMKQEQEVVEPQTVPVFLSQTKRLKQYLQSLPYEALKDLLCCNDQIAQLNYERYQAMDLTRQLTPAIVAFDGIQYQYMAPHVFDYGSFDYVQNHVRILSGFYGLLKPLDGVVPYRLELQAKLQTNFCRNLYDFWKDMVYRELVSNDNIIVNLASMEYSKLISRFLKPPVRMITCIFGELQRGKIREKGVYVKMARGEMVQYMAKHNVQAAEGMQHFSGLGYSFSCRHSNEEHYIFLK